MPSCPRCTCTTTRKDGIACGRQRYRCGGCGRTFTTRTATPFSRYRWPRVVIMMAVRWYTCYRLSTANILALLAERHIDVSARTILSWVHTFGPLLAAEGRRQARPLGTRWWCDETTFGSAARGHICIEP
jgi:transposase-like protein